MKTAVRQATIPSPRLGEIFQRSLLLWGKPISAALLAGLIFLGISATAGPPWRTSNSPYFNLLADAFLHGQLHLRLVPENPLDLSIFQGRYYLYWGPLPALAALPLVALFGVNVSDVLQTLVFAALTVGLFAALLQAANQRGLIDLTPLQRALLVLFFALGTAFTPLTESGLVWLELQVVTLGVIFFTCLAAIKYEDRKAFFLTGCGLSAILLTRPSAGFVGLFLGAYLLQRYWHAGLRRWLGYCLAAGLPLLLSGVIYGLYNYYRFGSPLDNGLTHHIMSVFFFEDYKQYGYFNLHFIPANFYYTYIFYPYDVLAGKISAKGGSLFLLSPLFFAALYALWQERRSLHTWTLLGAIVLTNLPILTLMGPGSFQFGPRYTLDFFAPLLLLTAMGMKRWPNWLVGLLVAISILQYLLGTLIYVHVVSLPV